MVKKIECIETRRYVYEPDLDSTSSYYVEYDVDTAEGALELDKKDVESGATTLHDIAQGYYELVERKWQVIDEP